MVAAFAGHGLGLNRSDSKGIPEDNAECFPTRPTLLVEYTENALFLHHEWMDKALEIPWPSMILKMSFDMGSMGDLAEEDIRDFILEFLYDEYIVRDVQEAPKMVTVISTGSASSLDDGKVERAAKSAVAALGLEIDIYTKNPEYIAAYRILIYTYRLGGS
jgi:hypothetical protein